MNEYRDGFTEGYFFAREELLERISEVEELDSYTIERICDMIESNKI